MTLVKWSRFANIIERAYLVATCHHISAVHKCLHFKLTKLKNKSILKCCCYGNSCTIKINKNSITKKLNSILSPIILSKEPQIND